MANQRVNKIFSNHNFTLYAVESMQITQTKSNHGGQWYGKLVPTAIIICSPDGNQALDMEANPIDLEKIKTNIQAVDQLFTGK